MNELKELRDLIEDKETGLIHLTEKDDIVKKLQEIGKKLITEYEIIADNIKIELLWIEAYYFNQNVFLDYNTHLDEERKNRFGQLFFHKREGRGGFDICLSTGNFYLSFLLKATLINGKFNKQMGVYDFLKVCNTTESNLESIECVLKKKQPCNYDIKYVERIGLKKPYYKEEKLAIFPLEVLSEKSYDFKFARKSLEPLVLETINKYIEEHENCTKQECKAKCQEIFGWVPDILGRSLKCSIFHQS